MLMRGECPDRVLACMRPVDLTRGPRERGWSQRGRVELMRSKNEEALEMFRKALHVAEASGDQQAAASTRCEIGMPTMRAKWSVGGSV